MSHGVLKKWLWPLSSSLEFPCQSSKSHVEFKPQIQQATFSIKDVMMLIFLSMSINFMSYFDFKKQPCHPGGCKGQGPPPCYMVSLLRLCHFVMRDPHSTILVFFRLPIHKI